MPEGHVSHRNARRFGEALTGAQIVRVTTGDRVQAQRMDARLVGDTVTGVEAVGKHHLFRFASGRVLHSHLGMNGRWRLLSADRAPSTAGLWLAMWTHDHVAAQYNGPTLRLYEPGEPIPTVSRVGPDLLDATRDPGEIAMAAIARADQTRPIGEVLMDQRLLSGIGNVYRAETLFLCGLDPWRATGTIDRDQARALGVTAAELLAEGVRSAGPITTRGGRTGDRTWVYGRAGRPCRRCGATIRSRGMGDANRTAYWCPACQT